MPERDDDLQGEAQTLRAVLARFESDGYAGQLAAHEGGVVHCFTCGEDSAVDDVEPETIRRLERASDPADMLAVVPITYPRCTARGTMVLNYGPESMTADPELLAKLPDIDHPPT